MVPLAVAGIALINNGLGKSRSAAHAMLASLCVVSVAAIVYTAIGFSWEGFAGRAAHVATIGGKPWDWIAAQPFFLRGLELNGSPASLSVVLQMFAVGIAAMIPLSAAADRWRLGANLCFDGSAGRMDIPAVCALGMGRRLAGPAWHHLRTR